MVETAGISDAPLLRVNPALDPKAYADTFRREGIVQVGNFFEPAAAEWLTTTLKENTAWLLTYPDEQGGARALGGHELAQFDSAKAERFLADIVTRASTGFAYLYLACHLSGRYGAAAHAAHPLHQLVKFLNSPPFLDFGRQVTGEAGVGSVDAAATCYRPGDFLNLHTDHGEGRRRAAYTLGFTRGWRTDWGGQLLFHDQAGDITRGLMPGFNLLTLFKTPRAHSVAQVASYATEKRLTISGWLLEGQTQPV